MVTMSARLGPGGPSSSSFFACRSVGDIRWLVRVQSWPESNNDPDFQRLRSHPQGPDSVRVASAVAESVDRRYGLSASEIGLCALG